MPWKPIGIASLCVATAYITKNNKENYFEMNTYHSLYRLYLHSFSLFICLIRFFTS